MWRGAKQLRGSTYRVYVCRLWKENGGGPENGQPPRYYLRVVFGYDTLGQEPPPSFMLPLFRISVRESGSFLARAGPICRA